MIFAVFPFHVLDFYNATIGSSYLFFASPIRPNLETDPPRPAYPRHPCGEAPLSSSSHSKLPPSVYRIRTPVFQPPARPTHTLPLLLSCFEEIWFDFDFDYFLVRGFRNDADEWFSFSFWFKTISWGCGRYSLLITFGVFCFLIF